MSLFRPKGIGSNRHSNGNNNNSSTTPTVMFPGRIVHDNNTSIPNAYSDKRAVS